MPLQAEDRMLSRQELVHLASLFVQCGVDKIRLTGGEPTLRPDILDIVRDLAALPGVREVSDLQYSRLHSTLPVGVLCCFWASVRKWQLDITRLFVAIFICL